MSSPLPVVGSASSGYSIRDAIASYHRSQYLLSTSGVATSFTNMEMPVDYEASILPVEEEDEQVATPRAEDAVMDGFIGNMEFDEETSGEWDLPTTDTHAPNILVTPTPQRSPTVSTLPRASTASERTPLLSPRRKPSLPTLPRRVSSSALQPPVNVNAKSTFGQTLSNAVAILLGIGMLSEPLAFSYAGWIAGTALIIFYGFITCYTAKFLARVTTSDPRIRSYADIGRKAFGPKSMPFVTFMFCVEIFSVSVILVTLYADSLNAVVPAYSPNAYKIMGLVVLIPTVFLPLSLLSYSSLLGILSTIFLIAVIFIDGFMQRDGPGSLWSPADTNIGIGSLEKLGLAFGLFMAGFGAHAAIPSLAGDMMDPSRFDEAMNYAFAFATFIYSVIGIAGYLMFGDGVYDEISQNLLEVPGYSPVLNKMALWMLVITPLTKFALGSRALNITLEVLLGLDDSHLREADGNESRKAAGISSEHARKSNKGMKRALIAVERVCFVLLAVAVSILVPDFSSMMAILGSFSAFVLCVIGPVAAKLALERKRNVWDLAILLTAVIMAGWGSAAAFWSA